MLLLLLLLLLRRPALAVAEGVRRPSMLMVA
jgi:hypothetical protein